MWSCPIPEARQALMVDPTLHAVEPVEYNAETADVRILCGGRSWPVHADVITKYSNFFKRALSGFFLEARTKEITMHGIDHKMIDLVIDYVYSGWRSLRRRRLKIPMERRRGLWKIPNVHIETIAQLLIAADYLDMELLCRDAYSEICEQVAKVVFQTRSEIQWKHNVGRDRPTFMATADILRRQGSSKFLQTGQRIARFFNEVMLVDGYDDAFALYCRTFPDRDGDSDCINGYVDYIGDRY
ncbi:hypothetical protein F5B20DRAFT_580976 [Whalleya microplaca]|nr:hypothetical protein F5B20DRAFT_580976 [Whalleya microplaca]